MSKKAELQNICDIIVGKTPFRANNAFWGVGSPWLSIADMTESGKYIEKTKEQITKKAIAECNNQLIPLNTVLLSFKLSIGKVAITKIPLYTNEAIAALIIKDRKQVDSNYLYYALKAGRFSIGSNRAVMGSTLNKQKLKEIQIPIYSLEEQRRIVEILDQANFLRQKRKEQIKLLDDFLKSKFLEMFGDPLNNPKQVRQAKIGEVGTVITGNTPSRQNKDYYGDYIEWIKSDNINTPQFTLTKAVEFLSKSGVKVGRIAPKGSVLVTCIAGSPECIGNSAMTDRDVAFNQQINAFTPGNDMLQEFFFTQLWVCKGLIQQCSSNSMKGLVSKSKFSNINILVPKKEYQLEFVKIFNNVMQTKQSMQGNMLKMGRQFDALIQEYFG